MSHTEIHHDSFFKKWTSLFVMTLALAIIIIDTTLLNVSLSNIIKDLNTDLQSLQWVIATYALILTAFTITGGRIGDIFGRKKMFRLGAVIFAFGSFIASISHNVGTLLIGESIIEGIGAALMMPATSSLLVSNFKGRERAIAFGIWGGVAATASAIGPIIGGFLTSYYTWRWGFRINVFVVIILLLGSILIKESSDKKDPAKLDSLGVLLSGTGLFSILFGIIEASSYGWITAKKIFYISNTPIDLYGLSISPFFILFGLILIVVFILSEMRNELKGKTPLIPMKIFQNSQFTIAIITMGVLSLSQAGIFFSLPIFLQAVKEMNALQTGLALMPMSLTLLIFSLFSAFISKKITPKRLIQIGLFLNIIAVIMLRYSINVDVSAWDLVPSLLLYGCGMGLISAQINNMALSAVPLYQSGIASGINNTLRQLGTSLGSAVIGTVLISTLVLNMTTDIQNSKNISEEYKPIIIEAIDTQASNIEFNGGPKINHPLPKNLGIEIKKISNQSIVDANKYTLIYTALFAVLALIISFRLPNLKNLERH